jgi:hypothetical protein
VDFRGRNLAVEAFGGRFVLIPSLLCFNYLAGVPYIFYFTTSHL